MLDALPVTYSSHEAFGTAHVPYVWVGEDFGDSCDGFTAPGNRYDGGDLRSLPGTNDLVDPEHVVSYEISGFLNCSILRKRKRFLFMGTEIDAMRNLRVDKRRLASQIRRQSHDKVPRLLGYQQVPPDALYKIDRRAGLGDDFGTSCNCSG